MKRGGRNVIIFYGSQTGTAEELANRLAKECKRYGMKGLVVDPDDCNMDELVGLQDIDDSLAIFIMATTGEGDPTDNTQEFYDWLLDGDYELDGVRFAVFGLGNKTYENYNAMGRYVDERLEELGATRVFELGLGDDADNLEENFLQWKERFLSYVQDYFGIENTGEVEKREYELKLYENVNQQDIFTGEVARLRSFVKQKPPFYNKNPFLAPVRLNRQLQKGGERVLIHMEIDISGSNMKYQAGDHVALHPVNNCEIVEKIGTILNTNLDQVFSLDAIDPDISKKHPFPCPTTYRIALSHYLDITSCPKSHILKELIDYTSDPTEAEQLRLMSSSTEEGKALYNEWITIPCRTILHVLEDLPSCKPPLDYLCELLSRLQPRYYSISSSSKVHPNRIHITCVLVRYKTSTNRINKGVCTSWMMGLESTDDVIGSESIAKNMRTPCFVRKSQFRLPIKPQTPIIMIGPGTGLAPMRGFIQERAWHKSNGKDIGDSHFFFGCRRKNEDYIYQNELEQYEKDGIIKLHLAFSRDQPQKIYVTHLLKDQAETVWKIIGKQNGHIYVCGDAKSMARDVNKILTNICRKQGGLDDREAEKFIKKMMIRKRYSQDVWS